MTAPSFPVAFLAGLLSFLSPCVLPLVPSYLAYVGGSSTGRGTTFRNSLFFVTGFTLIFVTLGASASLLGGLLLASRGLLIRLGGALVIVFGLVLLGVFRLPILYRTARANYRGDVSTPLGATLMGMSFAIGWTPCIGPALGAILTLAGASATLVGGVGLLSAYAAGLALPFLLAALSLGSLHRFSNWFRPFLPWAERFAGVLLVSFGALMVSGYITWFNSVLIRVTPIWLLSRL